MTHDELLAKIDKHIKFIHLMQEVSDDYGTVARAWFALRDVVELHKPEYLSANEYSGTYCANCSNMAAPDCYYPCPTIQAIEKELG